MFLTLVIAINAQAQTEPEPLAPSTPTLLCPVDTTTPSTFNFIMTKPSNATWITIQVNQGNDRIYLETFPVSTICKYRYCKVNLNTTLPVGAYTWYAKAWNNNTLFGEWSEPANFDVVLYGSHNTECCKRNSNDTDSGFIQTIDNQ